jgi:hypothetical protein
MVANGLYKIKKKYYEDFPQDKHIQLKLGRPFFYAFKDNSGVYWLIPISSDVNLYYKKIKKEEAKRGEGNCMLFHIGVIAGKKKVFKICNMLPITDEYIDSEFTINNIHYIVKDMHLTQEISRKARNFIKQLELGRMTSQIDALSIRDKLIQ